MYALPLLPFFCQLFEAEEMLGQPHGIGEQKRQPRLVMGLPGKQGLKNLRSLAAPGIKAREYIAQIAQQRPYALVFVEIGRIGKFHQAGHFPAAERF